MKDNNDRLLFLKLNILELELHSILNYKLQRKNQKSPDQILLDATILCQNKVLALTKEYHPKKTIYNEEENDNFSYKIIMFEIDIGRLSSKRVFDVYNPCLQNPNVDPVKWEQKFIKTWKKYIVVDFYNNGVYFKDFSDEKPYNEKTMLNSNSKYVRMMGDNAV